MNNTQNKIYEEMLNLPLVEVTKVEMNEKQVKIYCRSKLEEQICPNCLKKSGLVNQSYNRRIRDMDLIGRKVYLILEVRQFHCSDCNRYFSEQHSFVGKNGKVTKRQEKWIFEICHKQGIKQVAALVDMGYQQVETIYYKYAQSLVNMQDRYAQVSRLGIDEFALRKGHKNFACVLVDLDKGWVIDVLPYRDKKLLISHFESKGRPFLNQIEVLTCDMWEAYVSIGRALFPNALIVIDRFHWMKHLSNAVDAQRKSLRKEYPEEECFKNLKWKLLKNKADLSVDEQKELQIAFSKAAQLEEIYEMKNTFQAIFNLDYSKSLADQQIQYWIQFAQKLNNNYLNKFIKTFNNWKEWIMNYFEGKYSNGVVEGLNNAIKTIKRHTYNMLNFDRFRARILIESMD